MIYVGILLLIFSLYTLLITNNALELGLSILRVSLSTLGLAAIKFNQEVVLVMAVFLYALISVLLLTITRSEVQIKDV